MFDHVHCCHGQPGTIDDATNVPVEADIVESVLRSLRLTWILFGVITKLTHVRSAEHCVVIERHLAVESQYLAVAGDHERIDLDHGGIEVAEGAICAE